MAEEQTYEEVVRENEDLLLRNSELELENSILKETRGRPPVPPPPRPPAPPPPPDPPHRPEKKDQEEDDLGSRVNVQLDFQSGARIVKVKTDRGKLMYTVSFLANPDGTFLVKVWKFGNLMVPVEIVREEFGSEGKECAVSRFKKLIADYINLVKSETQAFDPRQIFDDCVNYRIIDPDCCRNCRFAVKDEEPERKWVKTRRPRTVCLNRKNISQYERVLWGCRSAFYPATMFGYPVSGDACGCSCVADCAEGKPARDAALGAYYNPRPLNPPFPPVEIDMKVVVDPRGVCQNYERGDAPPPNAGRYEDPKSFEFDRDLMVIIGNMVDGKIAQVSQEDVIVYCGDSVDTSGRS